MTTIQPQYQPTVPLEIENMNCSSLDICLPKELPPLHALYSKNNKNGKVVRLELPAGRQQRENNEEDENISKADQNDETKLTMLDEQPGRKQNDKNDESSDDANSSKEDTQSCLGEGYCVKECPSQQYMKSVSIPIDMETPQRDTECNNANHDDTLTPDETVVQQEINTHSEDVSGIIHLRNSIKQKIGDKKDRDCVDSHNIRDNDSTDVTVLVLEQEREIINGSSDSMNSLQDSDSLETEVETLQGDDISVDNVSIIDRQEAVTSSQTSPSDANDISSDNQVVTETGETSSTVNCRCTRDRQNSNYHCINIVKNMDYIIDHINYVNRVAGILFKSDILGIDIFSNIVYLMKTKGPSKAAHELVEVMYRNPDPAHHKLFYTALEETGQHELAKKLRGFSNEEAQPGANRREGHRTNENILANPDQLTEDKIAKQLKKHKSPVSVAVGFAYTGITGTLQDADLNYLINAMQKETIVELSELIKLRNCLKVQDTGKTDCLDLLTLLLQSKTKDELMTFLGLLNHIPGTSALIRWIKILVEKCECVSSNINSVENHHHEEKAVLVLPVNITTQSHSIETSDQQIVDILSRELPELETRVLHVEAKEISVKKKCVQISLVLEDYWDLENLQKSIECGLFTQRLRSWLKQNNYDIPGDTQFETTLQMAGQSDRDMPGKPLAHYVEQVPTSFESISSQDSSLVSVEIYQKPPQIEDTDTVNQGTSSLPGISAGSFESMQWSNEMPSWQKALAKNIFLITENLKSVGILQSLLSDQLDDERKGILKNMLLDDVKIFILLKHVVYRSIYGYRTFCRFLKDTGQFEIYEWLPSMSSGEVTTLEEEGPCSPLVKNPSSVQSIYTENTEEKREPYLEILEQPRSRGFSFRCAGEGMLDKGIQGERSSKGKEIYPTVQIHNYSGKAKVVIKLVTDEHCPRPHGHNLYMKNHSKETCSVYVNCAQNNGVVSFPDMYIHKVRRKDIVHNLKTRIMEEMIVSKVMNDSHHQSDINDIQLTAEEETYALEQAMAQSKNINLSVVRLCFQAYLADTHGRYTHILPPVYSQAIFDSMLKIVRMDKDAASCLGHDEVFLLCDKVEKDDIHIRFYEESKDGDITWEAFGNFGQADVHKQYGIVFRTPQYYNTNISKPVKVLIQLRRISDGETSNAVPFTYIPQVLSESSMAEIKSMPRTMSLFECDEPKQKKGRWTNTTEKKSVSKTQVPYLSSDFPTAQMSATKILTSSTYIRT